MKENVIAAISLGALLAATAPFVAQANRYEVEDVEALDGDTVRLDAIVTASVPLPGEPTVVTVRRPGLKVRLDGVNTPESFRPACEEERALGLLAKAWLQGKIDEASVIVLETKGGREKGKFGRVLGRLIADGADLNQGLIDEGLADPYDGGRRDRLRWCQEAAE